MWSTHLTSPAGISQVSKLSSALLPTPVNDNARVTDKICFSMLLKEITDVMT